MMAPRSFPLRQPPNHKTKPLWIAKFPEDQKCVFTAYVGIQIHGQPEGKDSQSMTELLSQPHAAIRRWQENPEHAPLAFEQFQVIDDGPSQETVSDAGSKLSQKASTIWVCFWTDEAKYRAAINGLSLPKMYSALDSSVKPYIGLWIESFPSQTSRLESFHFDADYLPGMARLPTTTTHQHSYTGYWGAMRDRISGSANDLFEADTGAWFKNPNGESEQELEAAVSFRGQSGTREDSPPGLRTTRSTLGFSITGTNPHNMIHVRSGQFWARCSEKETAAYLENLEPKLHEALAYLWKDPEDNGAIAPRYLQNIDTETFESKTAKSSSIDLKPRLESCGASFFKNMTDLERWTAKHPSHLALHARFMKHDRTFKDDLQIRLWHDVTVLEGGEAVFGYVNCTQGTGCLNGMIMEEKKPVS